MYCSLPVRRTESCNCAASWYNHSVTHDFGITVDEVIVLLAAFQCLLYSTLIALLGTALQKCLNGSVVPSGCKMQRCLSINILSKYVSMGVQ